MMKFIEKTPIDKGWSGDAKYCAVSESGEKYLLRISPIERKAQVERCFELMRKCQELDLPMCLPIEMGECDEGVYCVHSWIEGESAEDVIPTLSKERQYEYGEEAGRIAKLAHSFPAPEGILPWGEKFGAKIDRKLKTYAECPLKYEHGDAFIRIIEENRELINGRRQVWQHGDLHIGNMMIDSFGRLVLIDFDKADIGDAWEEFNRIVWSAQASPAFAAGMLDGYFGGDVPEEFWRLLALYICSNSIGSLPWAISYGEQEIAVMLRQNEDILGWYDGMERIIPRWYTEWNM